jgi:hypothetical protein
MVVTGVLARVSPHGVAALTRRPRGHAGKRLDDSKKLVSFGDASLGEAWARAIAARMAPEEALRAGHRGHPGHLLATLALDTQEHLRALCPAGVGHGGLGPGPGLDDAHVRQCWGPCDEALSPDDALARAVGADLDRLRARGVDVVGARVVVVCARRLNDAAARGLSRFDLDLHAMERLALDARAHAGADVYATCGKVGGFDAYAEHFVHLKGARCRVVREGRARSEYRVDGLGTMAFVRDADARHILVSMASLVGKWARDLLMMRVVRFYRGFDPALPEASGYHEPVTARFIEATRLVRRARGIEDACFERRKADPAARAAAPRAQVTSEAGP